MRDFDTLENAKKQVRLGARARKDDLFEALLLLVPVAEKWHNEAREWSAAKENSVERLGRT